MLDNRIVAQATQDVNLSATGAGQEKLSGLTVAQFADLYAYICETGAFAGFSAVPWEGLGMCDVIHEPTDEPEGLRIYVRKGWPVGVLEFDVGYRLVPGMIAHYWQPN